MTLATFALILSGASIASSVATLIYAVRIRKFISGANQSLHFVLELLHRDIAAAQSNVANAEQNIKQHVTAVLSDLGLAQKPEQK